MQIPGRASGDIRGMESFMNPNIRAVRYFDNGFRLGILLLDDEKRSHIVPITVNKEIRVKRFRNDLEGEVITEYLDEEILMDLIKKVLELGNRYGITEEIRRQITSR
jgi:hypothetical protein